MSIQNPYRAGVSGSDDPFDPFLVEPFVTRSYGGIGRLPYFLGAVGTGIAQNVFAVAVVPAMPENSRVALVLLVALLTMVGSVALTSYRMINQGSSGMWGLATMVPILNIFIGLRCLVCPEGYSDHKTLDAAGQAIVGTCIGVITLVIVAFFIAVRA